MHFRYRFVAIHLVVITADNWNACIHLLHFCSMNKDSMLREYKDGLRKAILRNSDTFCKTHPSFAAVIDVH